MPAIGWLGLVVLAGGSFVGPAAAQDADEAACLVRAAAQQANRDFAGATGARNHLGSLAARLRDQNGSGPYPRGHLLFLLCQRGETTAIKLITPKGELEDYPEREEIVELLARARVQARLVGLDRYLASPAAGTLGVWPLLLTVGPEQDGLAGMFRWTPRTISIKPGVNSALLSNVYFHEIAHFAIGTARNAGEAEVVRRFGRAASLIVNEAFAYALQYGAAYALALQGDYEAWNATEHLGFDGTPYRTLVRLAALEFPNLAEYVAGHGRLPDAFLARLTEAFTTTPTGFHLERLKPAELDGASVGDIEVILPKLYFLDGEGRQRISKIVRDSAWFAAIRRQSSGAALSASAQQADQARQIAETGRTFRAVAEALQVIEQRPLLESDRMRGSHDLFEILRRSGGLFEPARLVQAKIDSTAFEQAKSRIADAAAEETIRLLNELDGATMSRMAAADLERKLSMANAHVPGYLAKYQAASPTRTRQIQERFRLLFLWSAYARANQTRSVIHGRTLIERLLRLKRELSVFRVDAADKRSAAEIATAIGLIDQARQLAIVTEAIGPGKTLEVPIKEALSRIGLREVGE